MARSAAAVDDDDDTLEDGDASALDGRSSTAFDAAALTPQSLLAQILASATDQATGQTLANRLLGQFASLANLLAAQSKELLAFDGMKPQGVKLLCN